MKLMHVNIGSNVGKGHGDCVDYLYYFIVCVQRESERLTVTIKLNIATSNFFLGLFLLVEGFFYYLYYSKFSTHWDVVQDFY